MTYLRIVQQPGLASVVRVLSMGLTNAERGGVWFLVQTTREKASGYLEGFAAASGFQILAPVRCLPGDCRGLPWVIEAPEPQPTFDPTAPALWLGKAGAPDPAPMSTAGLAAAIANAGIHVRTHTGANDMVDGEITINGRINVQVGESYAIVHRHTGKGDALTSWPWPSRNNVLQVIMDLRAALSLDWKTKREAAHSPPTETRTKRKA